MKEQPVLKEQADKTQQDLLHAVYFSAGNFLELLPTAFYVCNAAGEIAEFNKKAVELWGKAPVKGQLQSDFFSTFHQRASSPTAAVMTCLMDGVCRENLEVELGRPDGTTIIINETVSPVYGNEGQIIGVINCFYDISEKKKAEQQLEKYAADLKEKNEELQRSEDRYHKMVEEVEDYAIILMDREGTILNWNKGAEKIKGYRSDEIVGKNFRLFYTEEDRKNGRPDRLIQQAINTGKATDEGWRVRKDGTRFWGSIVITALHDNEGSITGFSKVTRELTERKAAEEELKKSEERYHQMIEEVEDYAIILLGRDGTVLNWNKGAQKIKGYKSEEIVGKNFSIFYTPEDREINRPQTLINLAKTTGKAADEGWRVRMDGTRFWGSIVITALHNSYGEVTGFSKVTRDLTERKLAEDKLREYSNALEFQNKELEQFAYAASHDMKEPLRKIHLYNSFIGENPENKLDPKSREYLNRSLNAVKRMSDLIEDLLSYSKSTSNVDSFEETDMNELVEDVVSHHKEVDQKHVRIHTDKLPPMKIVPFQFIQLIDNLVSNAIKYRHPERSTEISITYKKVAGSDLIYREADKDDVYHKISVKDNGIGFEPQYEEKIFEIFQRLSTPTGAKGSGIGLAICKKIAQNHRGFIKAKGRLNEGATFEIYIPEDPQADL